MHTEHRYNRRLFFKQVLRGGALLAVGSHAACKPEHPLGHIKGSIVGANSATGHLLRNTDALPAPSKTIDTQILIIGSGISGLSARRWLVRNGVTDVLLLEMDDHFGGNAHHGQNEVSAYPWGAHYLPVPDVKNKELIDFLAEIHVITGFDEQGMPVYNEYHLCMDPEERLFINGQWQEGIVPEAGVPAADKEQIKRFAALVAGFKIAVGSDGKDAFTIPAAQSSTDEAYTELDKIPFRQYLHEQGFTSTYLLWYLEYGCKDDYGCNLETASAWAGLHYFSSRKGRGTNTGTAGVLTWPEGNGFLMEHLKGTADASQIRSGQLVYSIATTDAGVEVKVYDVAKKESYLVHARKVLMATPQYVNKHLLAGITDAERQAAVGAFQYAPWVIANITVSRMPSQAGFPLCWDNVLYGTASVGYVNANHQHLANTSSKVLTFYLPLVNEAPDVARKKAQATRYEHWLEIIVAELERAHPGITPCIEHADLWVWGHGMIAPRPGFVWGKQKQLAAMPIGNKIFFAHSDLSGISIFEEAFYQGIRAAKEIMQNT